MHKYSISQIAMESASNFSVKAVFGRIFSELPVRGNRSLEQDVIEQYKCTQDKKPPQSLKIKQEAKLVLMISFYMHNSQMAKHAIK